MGYDDPRLATYHHPLVQGVCDRIVIVVIATGGRVRFESSRLDDSPTHPLQEPDWVVPRPSTPAAFG